MHEKISQQQIAKDLNLSQSTVSMVLRHPERARVSDETRARILIHAKSLGYRPARKKPIRVGNRIGLLISVGVHRLHHPLYMHIIDGVYSAAAAAGLQVITAIARDRDQLPIPERVGSIILTSPVTTKQRETLRLFGRRPLVFLNAYNQSATDMVVLPDDVGAIRSVVMHLVKRGHRRIAFIGRWSTQQPSESLLLRLAGWRAGLAEAGLGEPPCPANLAPLHGNPHEDYQVLRTWQTDPATAPTAVICSNDIVAMGVMEAATAIGLNIPRQLSVIGFDGIEIGARSSPRLATISADFTAAGRSAIAAVQAAMADRIFPARILTPCTYHDSESVCDANVEHFTARE